MEKGKFVIHMAVDIDLSKEGAAEEFAAILARAKAAGFEEFVHQITDGVRKEGERLGFFQPEQS